MTQELEKAKQILTKPFCFMQWQVENAKSQNLEPMDEEDIEYLLSLKITQEKCFHFDRCEQSGYDTEELFSILEEAKEQGLAGVFMIGATLNAKDGQIIDEKGYFVRDEWLGSTMLDEIYFTETAYINAEVKDFQNLFRDFMSVAPMVKVLV